MKQVSVIIPCYRDATTIARAIRSVVVQTYRDIEIIVVNDASPETSLIEAEISKFQEVRYIRNPSNLGLAATRNAGIRAADTELVAFLDADDEYAPNKIELQVEAFRKGQFVTCGIERISPEGARRCLFRQDRLICEPREILLRNTLNGAGLLASRQQLLSIGGYRAELRSCEDFDLWLRSLRSGIRVLDLGEPLYRYHLTPSGLSRSIRNISYWERRVIEDHLRELVDTPLARWAYRLIWILRHATRAEMAREQGALRDLLRSIEGAEGPDWVRSLARSAISGRLLAPLAFLRSR